ncbi:MAG: polysaccharide deacetylase family protein [Actinomycetota bacterium]
MHRRDFLAATAAGIFFLPQPASAVPLPDIPIDPTPNNPLPSNLGFEPVKAPKGKLYQLPKSKIKRIAWTVDDGVSSKSLREYLDFIEKYELRMTFFVTSGYSSWKKNKRQLQELVDEGRVQLANHTHTHPSLTRLSSTAIQKELRRCGRFIEDNFGVEAKPYYRPPYGRIDARVIAAAKDIGYTRAVMWNGSLGDSVSQRRRYILRMGNKWIQNRTILIDHVNDPTPKYVFSNLSKLLKKRDLETVTLDDVFLS